MPGAYKTLTAKQEAFVRAYMELGNATEAYHRVYNEQGKGNYNRATCARNAHEMLDNPKVTDLLGKLKAERAAELDKKVTRDLSWYMAELDKAAEMAVAKGDATALERVRMSQAKLQGLVTERVEQRVGALDPEEAKPDIAQLWVAVGTDKAKDEEKPHTIQ